MNDLITKYRPTIWDDVLGQKGVIRAIKASLVQGRARSFLFSGPAGCGKTTMARLIAKSEGCDSPHEIDAASNSGVDDMRGVAATASYRSMDGGPKVIIVDECHRLSRQAWDTLLKTIEEPPRGVFWVLCTTELTKVPRTIRSRCQHHDLKPVSRSLIAGLLDRVCALEMQDGAEGAPSDDVVTEITKWADGSPRAALNLLAKCWDCGTAKEAEALCGAVDDSDGSPAIELCRELLQSVDWGRLMACVEACKELRPEGVRHIVLAYMAKVARGNRPHVALSIMEAFAEPINANGLAPIIMWVGRATLAEKD